MYWYVLFVRTGREHKIERLLKELLNTDIFFPFIPLNEVIFKKMGVMEKIYKPLFPGYVFIQSEVSGQEFMKSMKKLIYLFDDIICVLKYSNEQIAMREYERQVLMSLCNDDFFIKSSSGVAEGDNIIIKKGPLKGMESKIKKINRHKRQAWIELEFMESIKLVSVALEIVEKVK